jgi:hypothetical protein
MKRARKPATDNLRMKSEDFDRIMHKAFGVERSTTASVQHLKSRKVPGREKPAQAR